MEKLLNWLDQNLLRLLIGFLIAFIPLWPKIPAIGIPHTWVYIRLEDFFIAFTFFWGFLLFLRKKVKLNTPLTIPIISYWVAGGLSLIFTLLFTAKHLANFFPNVAIFHFVRRIEYLGIFFLAYWSVKSYKDFTRYLIIYFITLFIVVIYGFGQRFFGFPAFLTMNEEFAKGIPLYLSPTSRLTSTFAGHYDLAAFLVLMIAFFTGIFFGLKKFLLKLLVLLINIVSLLLLLSTASRISFSVYLITISLTLYWLRKKTLIIPVIIFSIIMMFFVNDASQRFLKTLRVRQVVYDATTGQAIGTLENGLEGSVRNKEKIYVPITTESQESLPLGSGYINLPNIGSQEATTVATIRKPVLQSLKMATISAEIASISGKFLIKQALVYDISLTTRIQGEWPRAIKAFKSNIIFGTGYSSISLSNDNDYLRLLAETGLLGTLTFIFIFIVLFYFLNKEIQNEENSLLKKATLGLTGGVIGLCINALFIDVFEASKVAFSLWILSGIIVGSLLLKYRQVSEYRFDLKPVFTLLRKYLTSDSALLVYLITLIFFLLGSTVKIYFIGDDFTWLKWAATSDFNNIPDFFIKSAGFFYRPLAKTLYFICYNLFWLKPEGYHIISLLFHGINSFLIYLIIKKITNKRVLSFASAVIFALLSIHTESLLWIPASFEMIGPLFALLSFYFYLVNKKALSAIYFLPSLWGHESLLIFPLILVAYDFILKQKKEYKVYILFILISVFYLELRFFSGAHWLSGDYSYNYKNLPLNIIGNTLSYFSGIIAGPMAFDLSTTARNFFRNQKIIAYIISILLVSVGFLYLRISSKIKEGNKYVLFSIFAFFISLMPFIGLGNISERYAYFPSVWLVIIFSVVIADFIHNKILKLPIVIIIFLFYLLFIIYNIRELNIQKQYWTKAGDITYKTLALLRSNFLDKTKDKTFYIVNLPIKYGNAWVFPVGFEDGLWHSFGKETPKVQKINSIDEALKIQEANKNGYVFTFDNFEIKEVK